MNTSESTEERDNQTFITCLNLLYMHNVTRGESGSVMSVCEGAISHPEYVNVRGRVIYQQTKSYVLISTLAERLLNGIK